MLIASTPEGARDFVVPSRLSPGEFYALPQSPQLFKQLLMVGGLDRYYQIARCLRDEDLRADRQFEFMQLDAEMSFADADDVMGVIGEAVLDAAEAVTGSRPGPVSRMTWHQAQERYGSDKPDVRFGLELVDLGEVFAATEFRAFQADVVKGFRLPGEGGMSRAQVDKLVDRAKQLGAGGLVWMRVVDGGALECQVLKFLSEAEQLGIVDTLGGAARRPAAGRGGPAPGRRPRARHACGSSSAARRCTRAACSSCGWSTSRSSRPSTTTAARSPRTTRSPCRTPTTWRSSRTGRARTCSRSGRSPTTWCSTAGSSARAACVSTGPTCSSQIFTLLGISDEDAQAALRLPARRLPLRRAAARRVRVRHRPAHRHPGGRGQHPRGDRVPEDPVGRRPAHRAHPRPSTRRSSRSSASRSCPGRRT